MRRVILLQLTCLLTLATMACNSYRAGEVLLKWEVQPQPEIYGFEVYRADRPEGPFVAVTEEAIPSIGVDALKETGQAPEYQFVDREVLQGLTYFYSIRSINTMTKKSAPIGKVLRFRVYAAEKARGS